MEDEDNLEITPEYLEAMNDIMKPRVIDGEMFVSANGIREMVDAYAREVVRAALQGNACMHGVTTTGAVLDDLAGLMDRIDYVHSAELVPDTIPDDIMGT